MNAFIRTMQSVVVLVASVALMVPNEQIEVDFLSVQASIGASGLLPAAALANQCSLQVVSYNDA